MSPSVERTCGCWEFTLTFESLAGVKRGEIYLSSAVMSIGKTIIVFELVLGLECVQNFFFRNALASSIFSRYILNARNTN